ncbi:MAG TPA: hypothetical protein VFV31_12075 [Chitinophagaceae bacterium]|nr:hypothetical protein [Chitinophagaceae bacterium]
MKINNTQGLSAEALREEVKNGGRFVHFQYTVSFLAGTYKGESVVRYIRPGENAFRKAAFFTIITLLLGWWGVPSGPRHTLNALRTNWRGGKNVTDEVMATIDGQLLFAEAERSKNRSHQLQTIE